MKASEATELRHRKGSSSSNNNAAAATTVAVAATATGGTLSSPTKAALSPRLFYQDSPVPGAKKKWKMENGSGNDESDASRDSSTDAGDTTLPTSETEAEKTMTGEQVQKEESKLKKILVRVIFAVFMLCIFAGSVRDALEMNTQVFSEPKALVTLVWLIIILTS